MNKISIIAIDLAKNTFQLQGNDSFGTKLWGRSLNRSKLIRFLAKQPPCTVAMEACCGSHYWAKQILSLGHQVKVIAPQHVKPFVQVHKNDMRDACAIAEAAVRPAMPTVAIKTDTHLEIQMIHRVRERLVKERTAISNEIRGLLLERGIAVSRGNKVIREQLWLMIEDAENNLSIRCRNLLVDLKDQWSDRERRVEAYDQQLQQIVQEQPECRRLQEIDGVGPVNATLLFSYAGDIKNYPTGRHFSASIGLVPRQHSSGGKDRLMGISKQGNKMVRKQLVHGARAAYRRLIQEENHSRLGRWVKRLADSGKHPNTIIVALANKLARIAWAIMAKEPHYQANWA